jgi:hypothetical protein
MLPAPAPGGAPIIEPEWCAPHRLLCPWCGTTQHHGSAEAGDLVMRCENAKRCGKHFRVHARAGVAAVLPMTQDDAAAWYRNRQAADGLRIALDAYLRSPDDGRQNVTGPHSPGGPP